MANIVKIEWVERNKEFVYRLGQLQTLFGHSKSPFTVNGVSGAKLDSSKTSVPGPLKIGASTDTGSGTIGINDIEGVEVKVEIPLQEDFQLNLQSSFQSVEDMIPGGATEFIRLGKTVTAAVGNTNDFMSIFGFQVWEKTEPIEISLELHFHTIRSGWLDVWAPIVSLSSQSILSVSNDAKVSESNGKRDIKFTSGANYSTPGVSLANAGFFTKAAKRQKNFTESKENDKSLEEQARNKFNKNAKTVTVTIPGIINIGTALVKSAKPTFSKELTESGAPLWGKLDITLQSVLPAFDAMVFQEGLGYISKLRKKNLGDKLLGFVKNQF